MLTSPDFWVLATPLAKAWTSWMQWKWHLLIWLTLSSSFQQLIIIKFKILSMIKSKSKKKLIMNKENYLKKSSERWKMNKQKAPIIHTKIFSSRSIKVYSTCEMFLMIIKRLLKYSMSYQRTIISFPPTVHSTSLHTTQPHSKRMNHETPTQMALWFDIITFIENCYVRIARSSLNLPHFSLQGIRLFIKWLPTRRFICYYTTIISNTFKTF